MKIYTRRGDRGETDLFAGGRVRKDHPRVEAYGAVDELNSALGVAIAHSPHDDLRALCCEIQARLFDLGAYLAAPDAERRAKAGIAPPQIADVHALEGSIDRLERELSPLKRFVLPGGTAAALLAGGAFAFGFLRRQSRAVSASPAPGPTDPDLVREIDREFGAS